jgi:hypothetical protein
MQETAIPQAFQDNDGVSGTEIENIVDAVKYQS